MNMFFRQAFGEYARQQDLKKTFAAETDRLGSILKSNDGEIFDREDYPAKSLLLLLPLVEIAWADGRVSRREMDAIVQAADAYGLVTDQHDYCELMGRLMVSRPIPNEVGRMWQDFHYLMASLPERERGRVTRALLAQAEFVAEQSAEGVIGFLRGDRICQNEQEALRLVADQLERAKRAAEEADARKHIHARIEKENAYDAAGVFSETVEENRFGKEALTAAAAICADDADELIPLIPLVKVAWAEGRITKRERELIFQTAERRGIAAGSPSHERLASWLELHPTDDFYQASLERISDGWRGLPEEEKNLLRLDLLSDCVNVAEASGGTTRYQAGGRRICDEEFAVVKRIAHKLNAPPPKSDEALLSLAA